MHVQELARKLGASADPALDVEITNVATIEDAGPGDVTFLANPRYEPQLKDCGAAAVLVAPDFAGDAAPDLLRVENPYLAFARAISLFYRPPGLPPGVHPTAVLGEGVVLGDDVAIGAYVVIGDRVRIGEGTVVHPHCTVYEGAEVGPGCVLHSHSVVREHVRLGGGVILQNGAVIGADGFGFAPRGDGSWEKIPQAGTVELAEDVEVQANACLDRATVGATTVASGTKVDNLVQVGHGCHIGENTLLCGQVGLAGSTEIGNRVTLAGQVGIAGHIRIGDDVTLIAQAGATSTIDEPGVYGGGPAMPMRHFRRCIGGYLRLPDILDRLKKIERQLPKE